MNNREGRTNIMGLVRPLHHSLTLNHGPHWPVGTPSRGASEDRTLPLSPPSGSIYKKVNRLCPQTPSLCPHHLKQRKAIRNLRNSLAGWSTGNLQMPLKTHHCSCNSYLTESRKLSQIFCSGPSILIAGMCNNSEKCISKWGKPMWLKRHKSDRGISCPVRSIHLFINIAEILHGLATLIS